MRPVRLLLLLTTCLLARQAHAQPAAPLPAPVIDGEVLILPGDPETLQVDRTSFRVRSLAPATKRVIEKLGDHFQFVTFWPTFDDGGDLAGAYSVTVKSDVRGIGKRLVDESARYGSNGVVRNVINMKSFGARVMETRAEWTRAVFPIWAQEYAHRWSMFMLVRDPRTGLPSELLLGRDCSHFARFVETGASVMDGYAWRDNGDGTFTWTERSQRFSALDLYAMGLYAPSEVPRFFFIDDIPGYTLGRCGTEYASMTFPRDMTIRGKRVDLSLDDVVFANGHRASPDGERADSFREALVVLTGLGEGTDSPRARALAAKLNMARPWWDEWLRDATHRRLLNCTKISAPCPDPRSDLRSVSVDESAWTPRSSAVRVDVSVDNGGTGDTQQVDLTVEAVVGSTSTKETRALGPLPRGQVRQASVTLNPAGLACGDDLLVRVVTQSEVHQSRREVRLPVGMQPLWSDGFETERGWTVNPDGDDPITTPSAGRWERATPVRAELRTRWVQPGTAFGGMFAFVTGGATPGTEETGYVTRGRTTLESPVIDVADARAPRLRYAVSFAGGRLGSSAARYDLHPDARLLVLARAVGAADASWREIDRLAGALTDGWTQRSVAIDGALLGTGKLQLRFVAADAVPGDGALEAALDDVTILSARDGCMVGGRPDAGRPSSSPDTGSVMARETEGAGGCSCQSAGAGHLNLLQVFAAAALVAGLRRRRRR